MGALEWVSLENDVCPRITMGSKNDPSRFKLDATGTEDLVPVAPVQRTPELDLGLSSRELHESAFPLFRARGARGVHVPASPFCCFVHRNGKLRARRQCRGWSGHVLLVPVVVPRWSEPAPLLLRGRGWGKREVAFQQCASRT